MPRLGLASLCLVISLVPARAQTGDQKNATISFLQSLQTKEGGFIEMTPAPASSRQSRQSLRSTTAALRAIKYFGGEVKNKDACAHFVEQCFDKDTGGFRNDVQGKPDVINTAVGLMALVELKVKTDPYGDAAVKYLGDNAKSFEEIRMAAAGLESLGKKTANSEAWLEQIAKLRQADGTYGKDDGLARETGSAVVTVLRLGAKVEKQDEVLKALKAGQRNDGGFGALGEKGSDLASAYRILRAFHMLRQKPDVDKLRAFVAKCRNKDGGYAVTPGKESTASATYFAGSILRWLEDK